MTTAALWLANAFSLNMLPAFGAPVEIAEIDLDEARRIVAGAVSAVGHAGTAAILAQCLGREVALARVTVTLRPGDAVLVAQYAGPRLPEGATELPDGAGFRWFIVRA